MKIDLEEDPSSNISDFAERHGLTMKVCVREDVRPGAAGRYYAFFDNVEEKRDGVLVGCFGNGATPRAAIVDYIPQISGKRLVYRAMAGDRREINAPYLDPESAPSSLTPKEMGT